MMMEGITPEMKVLQTQFEELKKLQGDSPVESKDGESFDEIFTNLINDVDMAQKDADTSIQQLVAGESTSIQDVVMKMEEADVAFKLMKEVRNKLMEAYKEILSMS
jgi:flagellar hook-basal body complex protein FliE